MLLQLKPKEPLTASISIPTETHRLTKKGLFSPAVTANIQEGAGGDW